MSTIMYLKGASWNGGYSLRAPARGINVYSTKVETHSHGNNMHVNENMPVNLCITVIDQNYVDLRPHAFSQLKNEDSFKKDCGEKLLAWSDGFNNLGYNRGYSAWFKEQRYGYNPSLFTVSRENNPFFVEINDIKREKLSGWQTALIKYADRPYPTIEVINDAEGIPENVEWFFIGPRIIRPGGVPVADLVSIDKDTGRFLLQDAIGDIRHIFKLPFRGDITSFPISNYLTSLAMKETKKENDHFVSRSTLSEMAEERLELSKALNGDRIELEIDPGKIKDVELALEKDDPFAGYEHAESKDRVFYQHPGEFSIKGSKLMIRLLRSVYNHSAICTIKNHPNLLVLYKEIDEGYMMGDKRYPFRKGFLLEDTAQIISVICAKLNLPIDQALEMSEGGDPRMILPKHNIEISSYKTLHNKWTSLIGIFSKT